MKKKTVVVGMSGGVDSAVAAKILLDDGYNVIGLFMHNWEESDEDNGYCSSSDDWADVQSVSGKLGIPCYSVNFSKEYTERVFSYFLAEYKKGRTPNPDVLCNREIKFGPFREFAKNFEADFIATGHYADIYQTTDDVILLKAADKAKDQTYFLNQVKTSQLRNVLFPLGKLNKSEVRKIAENAGLSNAKKKDSTGICFIGERKFKEFLSDYIPAQKGRIVDVSGKEIGVHDGLMYYTIGQRRGLGIGGIKDEDNSRWYVVEKDLEKNRLIVSNGEGEELFSGGLISDNINYIGKFDDPAEFDCFAKFRYRQESQPVTVYSIENGGKKIIFKERQRAITTGQYVVLYSGDRVLGGASIEEVIF